MMPNSDDTAMANSVYNWMPAWDRRTNFGPQAVSKKPAEAPASENPATSSTPEPSNFPIMMETTPSTPTVRKATTAPTGAAKPARRFANIAMAKAVAAASANTTSCTANEAPEIQISLAAKASSAVAWARHSPKPSRSHRKGTSARPIVFRISS